MNENKDTESAGGEIQTSQYNKLRTAEYLQLRKRFFTKYPINHDCDFTFEDMVLDKLESLEAELEKHRWIPVSERLPEDDSPHLFSQEKFAIFLINTEFVKIVFV